MRTLLFILAVMVAAAATGQTTDTTIVPMNNYLFFCPHCGPYPKLHRQQLLDLDHSNFKNPMNYGAAGNGTTLDDDAIAACYAAADAANTGVLFPAGKTFLVSQRNMISLTHSMTTWAYGATIKMKNKTIYSALQFTYPDNANVNFIWLGGKLDGNQYNQIWPGNPHGGSFNGDFQETHGRFLGVTNAKNAIFMDVNAVNTVVDGITTVSCDVSVIANCNGNGGAPITYNGSTAVGDQGTYFKTRSPVTGSYFLTDTCIGGSIGIHVSFPEDGNKNLLASTVAVVTNSTLTNQSQNPLHFEDCFKVLVYNCSITSDTLVGHYPSTHFSNNTRIVSIKKTAFVNNRVNFNQSDTLKLAILENCSFVSQFHDNTLQNFVEGGNSQVYALNCTFDGRTAEAQTQMGYIKHCTFKNYGAQKAAIGVYMADSCTFQNGTTQPMSLRPASNGNPAGVGYHNTYISTPANPNSTAPSGYLNIFKSKILVWNDSSTFMGKLTTGIE